MEKINAEINSDIGDCLEENFRDVLVKYIKAVHEHEPIRRETEEVRKSLFRSMSELSYYLNLNNIKVLYAYILLI